MLTNQLGEAIVFQFAAAPLALKKSHASFHRKTSQDSCIAMHSSKPYCTPLRSRTERRRKTMCGIVDPLSRTNALGIWVAMQCASPSQNDRLSKKLTAIEQRLEDILMRISQESGSTEACLRDLNSIVKLSTTVTTSYNQLTNDCGNGSSFSKLGALAMDVGRLRKPKGAKKHKSQKLGNAGHVWCRDMLGHVGILHDSSLKSWCTYISV